MNIDIRVKLDIFEHPKIGKLRRRLGAEGVLSLIRLWLWAAANRCDGVLRGLDRESVELAAQWNGEAGALVAALCELRLLELRALPPAQGGVCIPFFKDGEEDSSACLDGMAHGPQAPSEEGRAPGPAAPKSEGRSFDLASMAFCIHDWQEHQAWASQSDERSRRARRAAESRWNEKKEEDFSKDTNMLCSNMLNASPSNAPRAKNREPETLSQSQSPSARPARAKSAKAAGQGGAGQSERKKAASPAEKKAPAKTRADKSQTCMIPAEQGGESSAPPVPCGTVPLTERQEKAGRNPQRPETPELHHAAPALPAPAKVGAQAPLVPELLEPEAEQAAPVARPAPCWASPQTLPEKSLEVQRLDLPKGYRPPSFADVEMYCALRGNGLDAARFMDWCEARNWRVGGELIRDWRALVRRWERRERENRPAGLGSGQAFAPPSSLRQTSAPPHSRQSELALSAHGDAGPEGGSEEAGLAGPNPFPVPLPPPFPPPLPGPGPRNGFTAGAAPGFAGLRATSVHQAQVRERDLIARLILNDSRGMHARFPRDPQTAGAAQSALPPEWADGR